MLVRHCHLAGLGNLATVVVAVALAYLFGYSFTLVPLLRGGLALGTALSCGLRRRSSAGRALHS
jgi:hypothetical protein